MTAQRPAGGQDHPTIPSKNRLIGPEELTEPQTKAALAYWNATRGDRTMPSPADIDPVEIPRLLACLTLIEVLDEIPPDFLFRIQGETARMVLGQNRMGKRLSALKDMLGPAYAQSYAHYSSILNEKRPRLVVSSLQALSRKLYRTEAAYLPLSRDGETVHRILVCIGILGRPEDCYASSTQIL